MDGKELIYWVLIIGQELCWERYMHCVPQDCVISLSATFCRWCTKTQRGRVMHGSADGCGGWTWLQSIGLNSLLLPLRQTLLFPWPFLKRWGLHQPNGHNWFGATKLPWFISQHCSCSGRGLLTHVTLMFHPQSRAGSASVKLGCKSLREHLQREAHWQGWALPSPRSWTFVLGTLSHY